MLKDAITLLTFTDGARDDFHEPDEQGISLAGVVGTKLDNAFGERFDLERLQNGYQEAIVMLVRDTGEPGVNRYQDYQVNLATLIALARVGAKSLVAQNEVGKCRKRG